MKARFITLFAAVTAAAAFLAPIASAGIKVP